MSRIKQTSKSKAPPVAFQKKEILKCGRDPIYFINTYVKISEPVRGLIPFNTFPYQDECVDEFKKNQFVIVNKSRQLGLSTVCAAYALWLCLFQKEKNILVIATKLEVAKNFQNKVFTMYDSLPNWLVMPQVVQRSVRVIKFSNGSKVQAVPTSADAGRGEALSLLIVDEAAHVEGIDELWLALFPTLSTGGRAILLSCVSPDTIVYTPQGPKEIGSFSTKPLDIKGGYHVEPYDVLGIHNKTRSGSLFYNNGFGPTKIVKSKFSELECSINHKFWAFSKQKGVCILKANELQVGDYISIQYGSNIWGNNDDCSSFSYKPSTKEKNIFSSAMKKITKEMAYALGLYIAEGSAYKHTNNDEHVGTSITFTCGDPEVKQLLKGLGFHVSSHDNLHYTISSKSLGCFMEYLGFDLSQNASQKKIPPRLLEMSEENIIAMLRGLFDGDGYSDAARGRVGYTSTSKALVKQIRALLVNLGILSYYQKQDKDKKNSYKSTKIKHNEDSHILELSSYHSKLFFDKIGFNFKRKQLKESANIFNVLGSSARETTKDVVPKEIAIELRDAVLPHFKNKKDLLNSYRNSQGSHCQWIGLSAPKKNPSRNSVLGFFEFSKRWLSEDLKEKFSAILMPNVIWVPIVSIEDSEDYTVDFSLNNTEEFHCHSVSYAGVLGWQTPNGVGNLFHRIWTEAQEGSNGFKSIEIPWYKHPERNQEWFETQAKAIRSAKGERGVAQELLCDFLSSGETFITSEYMDILSKKLSDPILKHDVYPDIFVWKRPEPGHNYLVTADVSRGNAKDFSAMCVIDINKDEVVADYKGKVPADKLADIMIEVGKFYNNALLCPELNTYGLLTAKALKDQEYPNLFYEKLQKNIYSSYTEADIGEHDLPGIQTTVKNRDEMLAKLENVLRNGHILIQSKRFHEELKTFIWKNGKAQAQKGYNDDLVMAYCLAVNLYNNSGTSKYSDEEIAMAMIAGMSNNKDTFSPWGQGSQQDHNAIPIFTSNGLSQHNKFLEHKRKLALQNKINPQNSETANNPQHPLNPQWGEFDWLLKD